MCVYLCAVGLVLFFYYYFPSFDQRHIIAAVINSSMDNKQNIQTLYDQVCQLGVVRTQYEFGVLCGRTRSWLSCCKASDREASVAALVTLAWNLDRMRRTSIERSKRADAKNVITGIWQHIQQRTQTPRDLDAGS